MLKKRNLTSRQMTPGNRIVCCVGYIIIISEGIQSILDLYIDY
jgi:hypothetical protein